MVFAFFIKMIEPLANGETRNKVIVKFWWSKFENNILTNNVSCHHCFYYSEEDLLGLWEKTEEL